MGRSTVIVGNADGLAPSPATAEAAAEEFFINRQFLGVWAPRPRTERWRPDQRERFERELARLEAKGRSDTEDAVAFEARRFEAS
jgi:hypothetical protein